MIPFAYCDYYVCLIYCIYIEMNHLYSLKDYNTEMANVELSSNVCFKCIIYEVGRYNWQLNPPMVMKSKYYI